MQRPFEETVTLDTKSATVTKDGIASVRGTVACFPILFGSGRAEVTLQAPPACDDQGRQPGALYDESSYNRTSNQALTLSRKK